MTPRWERWPSEPPLEGKIYMDAVLRPHRSLSLSAFKVMLTALIFVNGAVALIFALRGAYPVAGFLGLDVSGLWLAFWLNYRAGRVVEHVRVASERVHVASVDAKGMPRHWALNPIWARVEREGAGVLIRAGGDAMRVGAFLSPKESDSFAAALDAALYRAKRRA